VSLHGETGCTVTAGDVASLAQAIELLLNNPSLRSRLGRAARLRAEEQFRSVTMASSTLQTYEKILHPGLSQALETIPPSLDLSSSGPLEFATARTLPSKSF
jgi:hypothetical protein